MMLKACAPAPEVSTDEYWSVKCLALNVYHEARGEPEAGKYAVAHVVMNRVESEHYPNDVCEVVYQPWQFSWTMLKKDKYPYDQNAWTRSNYIAQRVYYGEHVDDPSNGATMFHATYMRPVWAYQYKVSASIGGHRFYR